MTVPSGFSVISVVIQSDSPSTRHDRNADPSAVVRINRALIVTFSPERVMMGVFLTLLISGAVFVSTMELAAPGDPPTVMLDPQFCPWLLVMRGLISSSDAPPPS